MDDTQITQTFSLESQPSIQLQPLEPLDLSSLNMTMGWDANIAPGTAITGGNVKITSAGTGVSASSTTFTYNPASTHPYNWANTFTGINSPAGNVNIQGNVVVEGEQSDIILRGQSLMSMLDGIKERLAWIVPNPELEAEWDELRDLGDRYRAMEQQCREKAEMWKQLKAMPPVKLDF